MDDATKHRMLLDGSWRDAVIIEAETWLNTPYHHKGRVKGVGVDCGGLLYELYQPWLGPFKPFPTDYSADWAAHRDGNELYLDFVMPYVEQVPQVPKAGFTLFQYGRNFSHAAIWCGKRYIHAFGRSNVGMVKYDRLEFFTRRNGLPRAFQHFDVSKKWLLSCSH